MAITVCAPQARAFVTRVRPFIRPSRPISRDVVTRVSPISIDIMHHFDVVYSMKISILLSFFTVSKLIIRSTEDSVNSYDSEDYYDDDDTDDGEPIPIPVKEDP